MANEELLTVLKQGVDSWNKIREKKSPIKLDLKKADLKEADLKGANLRWVNLTKADLTGAHLEKSNLFFADLRDAILNDAHLENSTLTQTRFQRADLKGANLSNAILREANLSGADFSEADLSGVDLSATVALVTNFSNAIFTGACLQDWNINSDTNLDNVICDYVYLKKNKKERRPSDPNKNFAPGEFTKLFQVVIETVDLIFKDGIEWAAFFESFQQLRDEVKSDELSIQAIEKKSGGAFVIQVEVPPDANKGEIEKFFKHKYGLALKAKEEEYKKLLQAKDQDIVYFRRQNTNLLDIIKVQASKPINITQIQGNNMAGDRNIKMGSGNYNEKIEGDYYEQKGNFGIGHMSGGEIKEGAKVAGVINEAEEKQTLAEAAAEIQKLLKQLEESNPTATLAQQQAFVDAAVSPTLKARFVSALQAGWKEALKEFLDNPYVNVGIAVLEGWQNSQ